MTPDADKILAYSLGMCLSLASARCWRWLASLSAFLALRSLAFSNNSRPTRHLSAKRYTSSRATRSIRLVRSGRSSSVSGTVSVPGIIRITMAFSRSGPNSPLSFAFVFRVTGFLSIVILLVPVGGRSGCHRPPPVHLGHAERAVRGHLILSFKLSALDPTSNAGVAQPALTSVPLATQQAARGWYGYHLAKARAGGLAHFAVLILIPSVCPCSKELDFYFHTLFPVRRLRDCNSTLLVYQIMFYKSHGIATITFTKPA